MWYWPFGASVIISPAERRRSRRQRAEARRCLWLHCQGHLRLALPQLLTFRHRLSQHHSRDPGHLWTVKQTIRKQIPTMSEESNSPWKCSRCKRLIKAMTAYLLPSVRRPLDSCSRCQLPTWPTLTGEGSCQSRMEMGAMDGLGTAGNWSQRSPKTSSIPATEKSIQAKQAISKRQREIRGHKFWQLSFATCFTICCPTSLCSFFPSSPMVCGEIYGTAHCKPGADFGGAESLPRPGWDASRAQGHTRQNREFRDEAHNLGLTQVDSCLGTCYTATTGAPRVEGTTSCQVASAPDLLYGGVASTNGELRQTAAPIQHNDPTGHHGASHCQKVDTAAECQGGKGPELGNIAGGIGGFSDWLLGTISECRREEAESQNAGTPCEYSKDGNSLRFRGHPGGRHITLWWHQTAEIRGTVYTKGRVVSAGRIVSCLRKGQCGPLPNFKTVCICEVEAYGLDSCAAGSAITTDLTPLPLMHSVRFEDDCIYEFAAIGNASLLHGEALLECFQVEISKIDKPFNLQVVDYGVDLSTSWTEDDPHWTTPCHGPQPTMLKPNPGITQHFDSIIPYRHQTSEGHVFFGNTIPPVNWEEHRLFRAAAAHGAIFRDTEGELRVTIRSWIVSLPHALPMTSRDIVIRAQLLISIEQRIRTVWNDQINQDDRIRLSTVRPSPAAVRGQRPLHVLIEVNRRDDSNLHPVLLSHREIDRRGPSPMVIWRPTLLASPVSLDTFHTVCGPPCNIEQLLVPQPGRIRRWMQPGQSRPIHDGIYIPIWWDHRLQPTAEAAYEEDTNSLFQSTPHTVSPSHDTLNQGSCL